MGVAIFGSINMDLVVRAPRLPGPGETIGGYDFFTAPGGKGANQAVACARMGRVARMVGRVGDDLFGPTLRAGLATAGVDVSGVASAPGTPSGVALIAVDETAENTIIVVPGANGVLDEQDLGRLNLALAGASALLLQLEIPLALVVAAAERARRRGALVILDPAPAQPLPPQLYALADIITPNQQEAALLIGRPLRDLDDAAAAAAQLRAMGAQAVALTLGAGGVYWDDGARQLHQPGHTVAALDTVAAGDAFNGALAAALDEGLPIETALRLANAAGACTVRVAGAQPSLPTRAAVEAMLAGALV